MSADNGYLIRRNDKGKYVLQMYFASNEEYPPIDHKNALKFETLAAAVERYSSGDGDEFYSEYGLTILTNEVTHSQTKEKKTMQTETYVNNQYDVEVVRVTEENFDEVLAWCGGEAHKEPQGKYIQVPVRNPLRPRQEKAFVGDWVLKSKTGFKSYTDVAFHKSFSQKSAGSASSGSFGLSVEDPIVELRTTNVFHDQGGRDGNYLDKAVDPRNQISGKR